MVVCSVALIRGTSVVPWGPQDNALSPSLPHEAHRKYVTHEFVIKRDEIVADALQVTRDARRGATCIA